jgi:hypothetical protein
MLYERKQEYEKIVACYLLDPARQSQVFSFLHKMFCFLPTRKEEFQKQIKDNLEVSESFELFGLWSRS